MVGSFRDVIQTLDTMQADGVIAAYAVGGAVAFIVWDEPVATQDLDVVVIVAGDTHPLDPLRPVLDWLAAHDIALDGEYAVMAGVPVQFLPVWHPIVEDAVREAATVPYDGATMRVVRPAHLIAMWQIDPAADSPKRRERAARLIEAGHTTRADVNALIERFSTP